MKLTQRLLLGSLLIVGVLVALVVAIIDGQVRSRLVAQRTGELGRQARLVAADWALSPNADSIANIAGRALGHRITLIDSAGVVLGDSEFDPPALGNLENFGDRPEVRSALATGTGDARLVIAPAGDEELYVAVAAPRGIVRVSESTRAMRDVLDDARRGVLLAALTALLIALILTMLFSGAVARPVVELRDVARALAAGDLSRRPSLNAPGEVGDLASAVHRLAEQLSGRLAALEAEEALLARLSESLNEGIVAIDARQQVVRINDNARRMLGARDPVPFPAVNLPRERSLREAVTAGLAGKVTESLELELAGRELALTARPLAMGGVVLAIFDLTPMRRLEAVRRDFVANVSHELRTPLTVLSGVAETLLDDELPADARRHFVERILSNSLRMQRIVDDLLDLSRIESGGWTPNPAANDVSAVVGEMLAGVRARAEAKGIALTEEIASGADTVWADPTALRQVIGNLVDNAVRHTQQGTVTVFADRNGRGVTIGVRDTGIGIAADHLPRIFERFYRVDAGRSRAEGGTGLGLAIVKHMVEAHGGRVHAESTMGRGTTIAAEFPDAPPVTGA